MTSKPKLLVTRKLTQDVEDRIAGTYDAIFNRDDRIMSSDEQLALADGCDAILLTSTEKHSAEHIAKLPSSVRILATFSVGYDHIDVPAATSRNITVTNTPDVLTAATADIALLLLLGAARGTYWAEPMVRDATWTS